MRPDLAEALKPFREDPAGSVLLFDLDGTLSPIVPHPRQSRVSSRIRSLLRGLCESYGKVGVISGRPARETQSLVGVEGAVYVGQHGMEEIEGERLRREAPARTVSPAIAHLFRTWSSNRQVQDTGLYLENKGIALAVHYRRAAPGGEELARRLVSQALLAYPQLSMQEGKKVLELKPGETDKGTAVYRLLSGRGFARALYAGDDLTDIHAFQSLERLAGEGGLIEVLTLAVGGEELHPEVAQAARITLSGPEELEETLAYLAGQDHP